VYGRPSHLCCKETERTHFVLIQFVDSRQIRHALVLRQSARMVVESDPWLALHSKCLCCWLRRKSKGSSILARQMQHFEPQLEIRAAHRSLQANLVWQGSRRACLIHIQLEVGPKGWPPLGRKEVGTVENEHLSRFQGRPGYQIEVGIGFGKLEWVRIALYSFTEWLSYLQHRHQLHVDRN